MARKSRLPLLGDIPVTLPPRTTADGTTVTYIRGCESCVVCTLDCYVHVDGVPLHSDRCHTYYQRAG
jgi:hypothetical protein